MVWGRKKSSWSRESSFDRDAENSVARAVHSTAASNTNVVSARKHHLVIAREEHAKHLRPSARSGSSSSHSHFAHSGRKRDVKASTVSSYCSSPGKSVYDLHFEQLWHRVKKFRYNSKNDETAFWNIVTEYGSVQELLQGLSHEARRASQSKIAKTDRERIEIIQRLWSALFQYFPEAAENHLQCLVDQQCWGHIIQLFQQCQRMHLVEAHQMKLHLQLGTLLQKQWSTDCNLANYSGSQQISGLPAAIQRHWVQQQEPSRYDSLLAETLYPSLHGDSALTKFREDYLKVSMECQQIAIVTSRRTTSSREEEASSIQSSTTRCQSPRQRRPQIPEDSGIFPTKLHFSPDSSVNRLAESLAFPVSGLDRMDKYWASDCPRIAQACRDFLRQPLQIYGATCAERLVYVSQGEVAYALAQSTAPASTGEKFHNTVDECDILVSDRATTCHILAIRSESKQATPLTSLTHIDADIYDNCLSEMVQRHVDYHVDSRASQKNWTGVNLSSNSSHESKNAEVDDCSLDKPLPIEFILDVVGGFDDKKESSTKITSWLFSSLAWLAECYAKNSRESGVKLHFRLRTCAVSALNTAATSHSVDNPSPIGRGLAIDLRTGKPHLAFVETAVAGPALQLRSARIWSGGGNGRLTTIRNPSKAGQGRVSGMIVIPPFRFEIFPELNGFLRMPDSKMILKTSTSPNVEESDFCLSVRSTLRFMKHTNDEMIFGDGSKCARRPLCFQRVHGSTNLWRPVTMS